MIYSKWGSKLQIIGYCGKHSLPDYPHPLVLLKVRYLEDGSESYKFAFTLQADDGIKEIDRAVDTAQEIVLEGEELKLALKTAE